LEVGSDQYDILKHQSNNFSISLHTSAALSPEYNMHTQNTVYMYCIHSH